MKQHQYSPSSTGTTTPLRNQKAEAEARNTLIMDIVGAFCEMSDSQRKTLVAALREKQRYFATSQAEALDKIRMLEPNDVTRFTRFANALLNDDIAELKAIKASSDYWIDSLNKTISDIKQGKNRQQDLTLHACISLDEKLELLLKHLKVLRAAEVNAALGMIEMSGVKL